MKEVIIILVKNRVTNIAEKKENPSLTAGKGGLNVTL
jgi:hypothetical protein